jgi:hypothetical protein
MIVPITPSHMRMSKSQILVEVWPNYHTIVETALKMLFLYIDMYLSFRWTFKKSIDSLIYCV